jgi:hypothetical protein
MNADIFEGYTGIHIGEEQFVYDTLLLLVILLVSFFGLVFRYHASLFMKMLNEFLSTKERHNLFNEPTKDNILFTGFLTFQMMLLSAIFVGLFYFRDLHFDHRNFLSTATPIVVSFCVICLFYFLKQGIYMLNSWIFGDNDTGKRWSNSYHSLSCLWGVSLYLPVAWLILVREPLIPILILFVALYVLFRITLIYMTIRIFYDRKNGLLYLTSYLCAQEIVPLLFLYEGLNYLYNTIETTTLWH